jgi:hypothetical protein
MTTLIPKFDFKDGGATPTGAANRPINEKLQETISVKDFGAVGDGVTNDTAAIENALNYLNSTSNGGTVLFPTGTYITTKALQLRSGVTVKGDGLACTTIQRTDLTPETIDGNSYITVFYVVGGWNHIWDLNVTGSPTQGVTTGSLNGITFGTSIPAKGSVKRVALNYLFNAMVDTVGIFLYEFENVQAVTSQFGFNFSSATQKTSLTFNNCYAANTGPAYLFNQTVYSVINSCAADNCNWGTTGGNPYGYGFGNPDDIDGVYQFLQCSMTLNSCGAEGSYGNGVISTDSSYLVINSMWSYGCMSLYQPNYTAYPNYAVGPIQSTTSANSLTINSPINFSWSNTYVSGLGKPIASVLAFNYDYAVFGNSSTQALISGSVNDSTAIAGDPSYTLFCKTVNQLYNNPSLGGVISLPSSTNILYKKAVTAQIVSGTGVTITIPITSQGGSNYTHMIKIRGINGAANGSNAIPFESTIGFGSLTSLLSITSNNAYGISSVTSSGTNLIITLAASHTNPILDMEIISQNIALINYSSITLTT